ncbi:MAG: hydroxymethylbilane synthase [Nitrososphaeraceae archaeon]
MINKLTVGTRGSKLAIIQTETVVTALKKKFPFIDFNVMTIKTKGDIDNRPIFTIDRKGVFEKEINEAVIKNTIDFAVHSLKDIPSDLSDIITVASIPKRSKPNDVLVSHKKIKLKQLRPGAVVGTSSLRRAIQLTRLRPDLDVRPIRGNVETRIGKTVSGDYDAIILAEAGLLRLGLEDQIVERFAIKDFVPAPGQGSIAVVCRTDNQELIELLKKIEDPQSRTEIDAERALLQQIEGGCRFPVGALAVTRSSNRSMSNKIRTSTNKKFYPKTQEPRYIHLYASIFSADGSKCIKLRKRGNTKDAKKLGVNMGKLLIKGGALDLAKGWRDAVQQWNRK